MLPTLMTILLVASGLSGACGMGFSHRDERIFAAKVGRRTLREMLQLSRTGLVDHPDAAQWQRQRRLQDLRRCDAGSKLWFVEQGDSSEAFLFGSYHCERAHTR